MAIVKGPFQFSGGVRGVSFYTRAGSDQVIMRTKGGPKARRLKVGKEFEVVRKHQSEWAGCVKFSQGIKYATYYINKLADFNVSAVWNGLGKNIQKMDTEGELGKRSIRFSEFRNELSGFNLNKNFTFNAVLGISPRVEINKETHSALITLPRINTANDLLNIRKLPYFRLIFSLGVVSDIHFNPELRKGEYESQLTTYNGVPVYKQTEWLSTQDIIPEMQQELHVFPDAIASLTDKSSYIVSMGIEFGEVGFGGQISGAKRAGAARILLVE